MKIKQNENGPYEKFVKYGAAALTDSELLAIILRTGTQGCDAVSLASKVLGYGSDKPSLLNLYQLSAKDLEQIPGIGGVKSIKLLALTEISARIHRTMAATHFIGSNPSSVADYFMEAMRHLSREEVRLVSLDAKCSFLAETRLSIGNVNVALISPRSIFLEALKQEAVNIILVHNHPSGDPAPSKLDEKLTKDLYQLSKIMEIPLLDHIIIGDCRYYSFAENDALF